jgi:hypothetical protein
VLEILPRMVMVRPPGAMAFTFFLSCIYFWYFCRCLICLMSSAMESLSLENSFNLWVSSIQMLQLKKKSTVRLIFPSTVMHVGVPAPAHPHTHKHPVLHFNLVFLSRVMNKLLIREESYCSCFQIIWSKANWFHWTGGGVFHFFPIHTI